MQTGRLKKNEDDIDVKEFATIVGLSRPTIYRLIKLGTIPLKRKLITPGGLTHYTLSRTVARQMATKSIIEYE